MVDESAALELTYFNQSYLKNTFHVGESYTFYGTVEGTLLRRTMTNPVFEREGLHAVTGCIVPVYPLTAGLTQRDLERVTAAALDTLTGTRISISPRTTRRWPRRGGGSRSRSCTSSRSGCGCCAHGGRP